MCIAGGPGPFAPSASSLEKEEDKWQARINATIEVAVAQTTEVVSKTYDKKFELFESQIADKIATAIPSTPVAVLKPIGPPPNSPPPGLRMLPLLAFVE